MVIIIVRIVHVHVHVRMCVAASTNPCVQQPPQRICRRHFEANADSLACLSQRLHDEGALRPPVELVDRDGVSSAHRAQRLRH